MLIEYCLKLLYIITLFYEVKMETCLGNIFIAAYYNGSQSPNALIEPGLTETLLVNCSLNDTTSTEWDSVHSIALYHSRNNTYRTVATIDAASDDVNVDRSYKSKSTGHGDISDTNKSFLSVEWDYPQYDKEGTYKCEFQGLLKSRQNQTCFIYGQAFSSKIQKENCLTRINIEAAPSKANPRNDQIEPGESKTLTVNCSIDGIRLEDGDFVEFLTLFHSNDPLNVLGPTVAVMDKNITGYKIGRGVVKGIISNTSESFLSAEWPSPSFGEAGTYSCESQVRTKTGKSRGCLVDADIVSVQRCREAFMVGFQFFEDPPTLKAPVRYLLPGITKRLEVRCLYIYMSSVITRGLDQIDTLTLFRSEIKGSVFKKVASINSTSDRVEIFDNGEVNGNGKVSNTENPSIYVRWEYPDYDIAGTYKCEATGKSMLGKPQNCSFSANVLLIEGKSKACSTSLYVNVIPLKAKAIEPRATSKRIEIGSTRTLQINCSINVGTMPTVALLNSLTLFRSKLPKSVYEEVASINPVDGVIVKDGDCSGHGNISSNGESFLYMEWAYPGHEMAGKYRCEANVTLKVRKPATCSSTKKVSARKISFHTLYKLQRLTLIKMLQSLEAQQRHQQETNKSKNVKDAIAKATNVESKLDGEPFVHLPLPYHNYDDHVYYLSKPVEVSIYQKNHKACMKHGGYLAEIDDDVEFSKVKSLLRYYRDHEIQISGSDHNKEGIYEYAGSRFKNVTFFQFAKEEPTGNNMENCLILRHSENGWNMYDDMCVSYCKSKPCSFLCERNHHFPSKDN